MPVVPGTPRRHLIICAENADDAPVSGHQPASRAHLSRCTSQQQTIHTGLRACIVFTTSRNRLLTRNNS